VKKYQSSHFRTLHHDPFHILDKRHFYMTQTFSRSTARIGMHYFPDTLHYRDQDLQTWLPELKALGARWVTLIAPIERAIPEDFLHGLIVAGIEPLLHFPMQLDLGLRESRITSELTRELAVLFNNYARWGVRYIALFDRPNVRRSWPASAWTQDDLVERFLDIFIPLAETALLAGLKPVFPPLEPGGDYWDTAFLQSSLRSLQRRCTQKGNQSQLAQNIALGGYAWTYDRPLEWGEGGPERWPSTQPYFTPEGSQDQLGFRIFDWYQAIAQAEIGHGLPILLLRCGSRLGENHNAGPEFRQHAEQDLAIFQFFSSQAEVKNDQAADNRKSVATVLSEEAGSLDHAKDLVLCANFWLLAASQGSPHVTSAWYQPDGLTLPIVSAMKQSVQNQVDSQSSSAKGFVPPKGEFNLSTSAHPIDHYLLLPIYAWGVADWDLETIRPFIQQHHATIGFSVYEARLANRVTILGEAARISQDALTILRLAGCQVEQLNQDGTLLALT
jgi:hypothetical protein